jgi:hypothetical protein
MSGDKVALGQVLSKDFILPRAVTAFEVCDTIEQPEHGHNLSS